MKPRSLNSRHTEALREDMIPLFLTFFVGAAVLTLLGQNQGTTALIYFISFTTLFRIWLIVSPLTFKNASIGMRKMGLRIVDKDGNCPPAKDILYRQLSLECQIEYFEAALNDQDVGVVGFKSTGTHIVYIGDENEDCRHEMDL